MRSKYSRILSQRASFSSVPMAKPKKSSGVGTDAVCGAADTTPAAKASTSAATMAPRSALDRCARPAPGGSVLAEVRNMGFFSWFDDGDTLSGWQEITLSPIRGCQAG